MNGSDKRRRVHYQYRYRSKRPFWSRRRYLLIPALLAIILALLLIFFWPFSSSPLGDSHFWPNPSSFDEGITEFSAWPDIVGETPVVTQLLPEGHTARLGVLRKIKTIVIHETDNTARGADAAAHASFMLGNDERNVSWHYTVDKDEIYHHLPDNEIAFHAGTADDNQYGIGIEICVNKDGDYKKAVDNAARLTALLLREYELESDSIKQHYDCTGKDCPRFMRERGEWDSFLKKVSDYLK